MTRLLFVKTSSLGDVVHQFPAVSDAARRAPGAAIDWVVEEAFAEVAALHPAVRRVLPVAVRRWRGALASPATWREMGAFRRALAAEHYDCVIDTQGLLKSALIARFADGPRHGYDSASAREPLAAWLYDARHPVPRGLHAIERNRWLSAAALGYPGDGACDYGLQASRADPGGKIVLLTMTSRADKLWPEERWAELGRAIGAPCVLPWGSEPDRERAERIARSIPGAEVPPHRPLREWVPLLRGARAVVGVDTGLAHLAVALGAPVVGIYCGSDPALTGLHGSARAVNVGGKEAAPEAAEVLAALRELG